MKACSRLFSLSALLLVLSFASACGPLDPAASDGTAKPRIALIMKSLANEFFKTMEDGAKAHQQAHPQQYTLIPTGIKDERDMAQQMKYIEDMRADGVDAIVVAPADSKALIAPCRRALDAGVVVVNIDNKLDAEVLKAEGIQIPFVGPDNRAGARKVGDYLAKHLKPGDEVAIIEGVQSAYNSQQRRQGFEDAMLEAGMKVLSPIQSGQWETAKANTVAAGILSEHPQLKAILCANDSMALGAVAAIRAADRTGEVLVVGFDNISAIQELLRDGRVLATADQHADQLAVFGIEYALQILDGQSIPKDKETPVDLVTAEDVR
jgi:ribose transport system substrate-binding protein